MLPARHDDDDDIYIQRWIGMKRMRRIEGVSHEQG